MTRAFNSKNLPGFLKRRSIAYEDFEHLVGFFEKGHNVSLGLKISVYRSLAELYKPCSCIKNMTGYRKKE